MAKASFSRKKSKLILKEATMKPVKTRNLRSNGDYFAIEVDLRWAAGENEERKAKTRTTFTLEQIGHLEKTFKEKKYLTSAEMEQLAFGSTVTRRQVMIHFADHLQVPEVSHMGQFLQGGNFCHFPEVSYICPKVTVILTYWEASGEVWELCYKSLLYSSSTWSYCSSFIWLEKINT